MPIFNRSCCQTLIPLNSLLISQFRFHTHSSPRRIKRGQQFSDVILSALSEAQTLLGYPAKPVSEKEFTTLAQISENGLALSVRTEIGKEVFKKLKEMKGKSHIIFCDFTGPVRPMVLTDPVSGNIYFRADCLRKTALNTSLAISHQISRTDIHESVHLFQYSSNAILSSEEKMSKFYPNFRREGSLRSPNFAHRLYSEAHAHYIEKLHLYQLHKLENFSQSQDTYFFRYIDKGLIAEAFAYILHYLITHTKYGFNQPLLNQMYLTGFNNSSASDVREREIDGAKEIMKHFATIQKLSEDNVSLLAHEPAFLFEPMGVFYDFMEPSFFDMVGESTENRPKF